MNRSKKAMLILVIMCIVGTRISNSEIFKITVFASLAYVLPLAIANRKEPDKMKSFLLLFLVRMFIIGIFRWMSPSLASGIDMFMIFIGMCIFWPMAISVLNADKMVQGLKNNSIIIHRCKNCNAAVLVTDKFCTSCGQSLTNNIIVDGPVLTSSFDPMYTLSDEQCLEKFILKEMEKAGIDSNSKLIAEDALKRKKILNIILSALVFIYVCLIFFHFPIYTYAIGLLIIVSLFLSTNKFRQIDYLKKKVKERPGEKISNIVMISKESMVKDNSPLFLSLGIILAIVLACGLFIKPRIIYEKMDEGYGVRFYAFGLTNFTKAEIPDEYKGKPVVSLRGNAFSNMPFLEEAVLSDNITEIRGQTFLNCRKLKKVTLPKNLKTIGGRAFANCTSLESVEFFDGVETMGGQIFAGDKNLKEVKLPKGLKSIGGGAFKECTSLEKIEFPEGVTELGGEMFSDATGIKEIIIPNTVTTIGGGFCKNCYALESIVIPNSVTELGGESFINSGLKSVVLSENLTEIRGDMFSNSQLESIVIPSKVERIGGHAFHGASRLEKVTLKVDSQLKEIGSSAFRACYSLSNIKLPKGVMINERAFKESPTKITYFDRTELAVGKVETYYFTEGATISIKDSSVYDELNIEYVSLELSKDNVYEYNFRINGDIKASFVVDRDSKGVTINKDIMVKVNQVAYDKAIYLDIYYN